jgi:hypothetical protein
MQLDTSCNQLKTTISNYQSIGCVPTNGLLHEQESASILSVVAAERKGELVAQEKWSSGQQIPPFSLLGMLKRSKKLNISK